MIAEGYATGRTIRMAINEAVPLSVCFDAGGIFPAARYLRDAYPDLHLLICADDDWKIEQRIGEHLAEEFGYTGQLIIGAEPIRIEAKNTWYVMRAEYRRDDHGVGYVELAYGNDVMPERKKRFENAGLKRAYEAIAEVGNASVVFPRFTERGERKLTDFNDLHCEEGLDLVKQQIEAALLAALAPAASDIPPFPHLQAVGSVADPLYEQAVSIVRKASRASISLVLRELRIGHNRAARLLERMEADGVVSAPRTRMARVRSSAPKARYAQRPLALRQRNGMAAKRKTARTRGSGISRDRTKATSCLRSAMSI